MVFSCIWNRLLYFLQLSSPSSKYKAEIESLDSPGYQPTPLPNTRLQDFNKYVASGRISPINHRLQKPLDEVAESTEFYFKRKARETVDYVLDGIAPGQSQDLLHQIVVPDEQEKEEYSKELITLIKLYNNADHWFTKQQILSIFAKDYSMTSLMKMVPGLKLIWCTTYLVIVYDYLIHWWIKNAALDNRNAAPTGDRWWYARSFLGVHK